MKTNILSMWQKDYLFSIIALITVVLGIWLPIGVIWEPFFVPLLGTLMFFLVWGLISLGVKDMAPFQFIEMGCVVLILLFIGYLAGWLMGKKINREYGITMALLTGSRNYTLAMVIGLTAFGAQVLPPIIAYIVVQNLSLIPLQILLKNKRNS